MEPDITYSARAFPDVQADLNLYPPRPINGVFTCGWYGTSISEGRGSFAIVNDNGPLADRIGDYLRVQFTNKSVTVYCVESFTIPYDIAITRRAYFELAELWTPYLDVRVSDIVDTYDGSS